MSEANAGERTRVGVVGLGGMGRLHASTFEEAGATIVAGVDITEDAREEFAESFDAAVYEHHEALLADGPVDAIVVTTPNRFHESIAVAALEADVSVLVEKPLAHSLESAQRIADAAAESRATCMVGFHNRHAAATQLFDAQRARDRFGTIRHVEANYIRRRGIPGTGSWFTDPSLSGGGALIDIGVHALDLALYTMGFPDIVEVSGTTRAGIGGRDEYADPDGFSGGWDATEGSYDVEESVSAFLRSADGRTISLEAAWATNRDPSMDFYVRGDEAGAHYEIGDSECRVLDTGVSGVDHYEDVVLSGDSSVAGYRAQDERFLASVRSGRPISSNTISEALQVQRIIDAIYESAAQNRAVRLDPIERPVTSSQPVSHPNVQ
ncbi:Gfo/Idh/MocA family protein [Halovivax limisalsi]|uniref:Gfo/Idh/MocA family protein n=1 Tax=Halovivax limisalsi TaxID=1453760 RepID=UPI002493EFEC|nr:Gfo/Idh/MocA family oxidoreductase [Halovivax limisalsi]